MAYYYRGQAKAGDSIDFKRANRFGFVESLIEDLHRPSDHPPNELTSSARKSLVPLALNDCGYGTAKKNAVAATPCAVAASARKGGRR